MTLAWVLGCSGFGTPPPPPPKPVPLGLEPPPPTTPMRTTLPRGPYAATDAWVGVVVDPAGPPWAPKDGGAVVVPSPTGWEEVAEGAAFHGLSGDGPLELAFLGVRDVSWGCGTAVEAATFGASPAPAPGVVWIVQEEPPDTAALRPKDARPPTAARRLYRLPLGGELDLQPGRSVVELGGARPFVDTYGRTGGLDLTRADAIGPTWPDLALTEGDETLVLVLRRNRDAEVAWEVIRIAGRRGTTAGTVSVPYGACE